MVQVKVDSSGTLTTLTEVQRRQRYLDKITRGAEVMKSFIESCLSNDPAKRPTMAAAIKALMGVKVIQLCDCVQIC